MEIFKLFGSIFVDNKEANESISKTDKNAESLGSKFTSMIGTVAKWGAAVGAAALGAGAAFYRLGAGFDDAFDAIAISSGATGEALEGLQDDFKAVFSSIPGEMAPAAAAVADLNTLTGATGQVLQDMSRSVLEASRLLGEDGTSNAKAFGKALEQWGRPAEDATSIMDTFFVITQQTGIGLNELMSQLNAYGPIMQNAGFTTEETADLMGRMNSAGISWSRISPALNQSIRKWAAAGKDSREELGLIIDAMRNAETEAKALTIATEVFGAQGAQRLTTAVRQGVFSLDDLGMALANTEGAIEATAEATNDFPEKWEIFRNKAMTALEPVASAVFGLAGTVMDKLGPVLESLAQWVADNMPAIQAVFETVFNAIGAVAEWFVGIIQQVIEWVRNWASENQDRLERVRGIFERVFDAIGSVIEAFVGLAMVIWDAFGEHIINFFTWLWDIVGGIIEGALDIIIGIFDVFSALFRGDWEGVWQAVKDTASAIWNMITGLFEKLWVGLRNIVLGAWDFLKGAFGKLWDGLKNWFTSLWENFKNWGKNLIQGLWDGIVNAWENLKSKVSGFFSGIGDMVKGVFGISSPSKLFAGIGEDIMRGLQVGLESMTPEVDATMTSIAGGVESTMAGAMAGAAPAAGVLAGSGSGVTVQVHVHGNVYGVDDLMEEVVAALHRRTALR